MTFKVVFYQATFFMERISKGRLLFLRILAYFLHFYIFTALHLKANWLK